MRFETDMAIGLFILNLKLAFCSANFAEYPTWEQKALVKILPVGTLAKIECKLVTIIAKVKEMFYKNRFWGFVSRYTK